MQERANVHSVKYKEYVQCKEVLIHLCYRMNHPKWKGERLENVNYQAQKTSKILVNHICLSQCCIIALVIMNFSQFIMSLQSEFTQDFF